MAATDLPEDYLPTSVGGVVCRAGGKAVGQAETVLRTDDSRVPVEDKLNVGSSSLRDREKTFKRGPWQNYFLVECYRKSKSGDYERVGRGTAFLTNLLREENGTKYATFLTAGHVLFDCDRVVLKHSSHLLKGGLALEAVEIFIDLREPPNKKKGWFEVCSKFKDVKKQRTGPYDYGAIFVKAALLELLMEQLEMSKGELFTVQLSSPTSPQIPVFVAGYPLKLGDEAENTYLAVGEGSYLAHKFLPKYFIKETYSGKWCQLPAVDTHAADTSEGMSGSPVVLGELPSASSAEPRREVIAIHVGGVEVGGVTPYEWHNAPDDFKNGLGVNLAVPITWKLIEEFKLKF